MTFLAKPWAWYLLALVLELLTGYVLGAAGTVPLGFSFVILVSQAHFSVEIVMAWHRACSLPPLPDRSHRETIS